MLIEFPPVIHRRYRQINRQAAQQVTFCSNDYLNVSTQPSLITAFKVGADRYGVSSSSSQYIDGYRDIHQQLEVDFADFIQRDKALVFGSGYLANLAILPALTNKDHVIFQDKLNHASLVDSAKLSDAKMIRYQHHNIEHLESQLQKYSDRQKLIVTESIFSMHGCMSPLQNISALATKYDAILIIDDAHGLGWLGTTGGGITEHLSLSQDVAPMIIAPLGKGFGCYGALVAGDERLINHLEQTARTAIYTTALPPAVATAATASIQWIKNAHAARKKLRANITYFENTATAHGIQRLASGTPIQIITLSEVKTLEAVQQHLKAQGLLVAAIRPPTVPKNQSCLRISLCAQHEKSDIDHLVTQLVKVLP